MARFVNTLGAMADPTEGWMAAAACREGPRRAVTFRDLPEQQQSEVVRLALFAAATTAYFVSAAIAGLPLASRSLAAHATLPAAAQPRVVMVDARAADIVPVPRAPKKRAAPPRAHVEVAALRDPADAEATPSPSTSPRRNVFSRFFRGLLRSVEPAA